MPTAALQAALAADLASTRLAVLAEGGARRPTATEYTLIRALKTDLSCMSVRLERLEALLSV